MKRLLEIPEYVEDVQRVASLALPWEKLRGKTLMITGGTGLIGSFLIDVLHAVNLSCHIILLGRSEEKARQRFLEYWPTQPFNSSTLQPFNSSTLQPFNSSTLQPFNSSTLQPFNSSTVQPFLSFLRWDANDTKLPAINTPVDFVLHLASNTHPVAYATDPIGTITTNVISLNNLLNFAANLTYSTLQPSNPPTVQPSNPPTVQPFNRSTVQPFNPSTVQPSNRSTVQPFNLSTLQPSNSHSHPRFLFASSNEIYGENRGDVELFDEKYCGYIDCNTLRAGYPESKRCGEALCQAYIKQKGLDCVIARLTRTYGPTILPTDTKAISQFFKNALAGEDIVLKSEGRQHFSYQYVSDSVAGLLTVLLKGETGEAYNIADESGDVTLRDLAALIAGQAGRKVVLDLPDAVEAAGFSKATKARLDGMALRKLGWRPVYDIVFGVERNIRILGGLNHG